MNSPGQKQNKLTKDFVDGNSRSSFLPFGIEDKSRSTFKKSLNPQNFWGFATYFALDIAPFSWKKKKIRWTKKGHFSKEDVEELDDNGDGVERVDWS